MGSRQIRLVTSEEELALEAGGQITVSAARDAQCMVEVLNCMGCAQQCARLADRNSLAQCITLCDVGAAGQL